LGFGGGQSDLGSFGFFGGGGGGGGGVLLVTQCTIVPIRKNIGSINFISGRSMYNFVNCLQFNIGYEKVERPAPVGGALV
jgi:hypothetical protein